MKVFLIIFIQLLLCGCGVTSYVNREAEGFYKDYWAQEIQKTFLINKKNLLLCFSGVSKKITRPFFSEDNEDFVLLLPDKPPFNNSGYHRVVSDSCDHFANAQIEIEKLPIFTIRKDKNCAHNNDCTEINWEIYKNNVLLEKGITKKEDKNNSKDFFNTAIFKHIKPLDKMNAIYAVEDRYGERQSKKITNGKKFYYKYFYEYHTRKYDLYYAKENEYLYINLDSIYKNGNLAWYVLIPFAIFIDIVTFPIQLVYGLWALNQIGN